MTFDQRVEAMASMGFTVRQAQFLTLVALHSGYCLRRQYAAYGGLRYGKNVRDFLDDLVTCRLARRLTFRPDRGHIYHLFSRRIYRAVEQEDNRNRRHSSPALIARKLMLLDFVLLEPGREWYATENEKVAFFLNTVGLPPAALPQRAYSASRPTTAPTVRYCVQKLPIFVTRDPLRVHLVCVVTDPGARDIARFVKEHGSLTAHLAARRTPHTVVAIRPLHVSTDLECRRVYAHAVGDTTRPATLDVATVRWYFDARRRIESGDLRALSVEDLRRYRECHRGAAASLEPAYRRWAERSHPPIEQVDDLLTSPGDHDPGTLLVVTLPHRYEQFGAMPGIA